MKEGGIALPARPTNKGGLVAAFENFPKRSIRLSCQIKFRRTNSRFLDSAESPVNRRSAALEMTKFRVRVP